MCIYIYVRRQIADKRTFDSYFFSLSSEPRSNVRIIYYCKYTIYKKSIKRKKKANSNWNFFFLWSTTIYFVYNRSSTFSHNFHRHHFQSVGMLFILL